MQNVEPQQEGSLEGAMTASQPAALLANQAAALGSKLTKALSGLGVHGDVEASQRRVHVVGGVFERAIEMDAPFSALLRRIKGEYEDALATAWGARADALPGIRGGSGSGGSAARESQTRRAHEEAELRALQEDNDAYAQGMRQLESENDELRHELAIAINHARESNAQLQSYEHALCGKRSAHQGGGGGAVGLSSGAGSEREEEAVDEESELAREMPPSARPGAATSDLGSGRLGRVRPIASVSSLVPALDMEGIQRVLASDEAVEAKEDAVLERAAALDFTSVSSSEITGMGGGPGSGMRMHDDEDDQDIGLSSEGAMGGRVAPAPSRPACVPVLALARSDLDDEDFDATDLISSGGVGGDVATVPKRPECVPSLKLTGLVAGASYQDEFVAHEQQVNGAAAAALAASGATYSHADAAVATLKLGYNVQ
jgi:hypothetical protein